MLFVSFRACTFLSDSDWYLNTLIIRRQLIPARPLGKPIRKAGISSVRHEGKLPSRVCFFGASIKLDIYIYVYIYICTPQKSNIDTKPSFWVSMLVFAGVCIYKYIYIHQFYTFTSILLSWESKGVFPMPPPGIMVVIARSYGLIPWGWWYYLKVNS